MIRYYCKVVKMIKMVETAKITRKKFGMYDVARSLLEKLNQYRKNPGSFHSKEIIEEYGNRINEYNPDQLNQFHQMLDLVAVELGLVKQERADRIRVFLRQEYDNMAKREMGEVKEVSIDNTQNFLEKVAGEHQAQGFKPGETGIKKNGVNDTQIFRDFSKKAEHDTGKFFSICERFGKRKSGSKSYRAPFEA